MRWVDVGDDHLVWLRETPDDAVLVHVGRSGHSPVAVQLTRLGYTNAERIAGSPQTSVDHLGASNLTLGADAPGWQILNVD